MYVKIDREIIKYRDSVLERLYRDSVLKKTFGGKIVETQSNFKIR